jgi:hypothetical protein
MKLFFAIFLSTVIAVNLEAQDKTTIPPGPLDEKITEAKKRVLKSKITEFLKLVTKQKRICKKDKLASAEMDLTSLYMNLVLLDTSFIDCDNCKEKNILEKSKHHPYVDCIFKVHRVRNSLKEILNDSAYPFTLSEDGRTSKTFTEMNQYYQSLLKDYED